MTEESDPELVAWALSENLFAGGYEYAEGMTLRYEYTFDAETQDVLGIYTELTDAEGEVLLTQEDRFTYDIEPYDPFAEGEPFAEYEAAARDPEQSRTITVVFDPDTVDIGDMASLCRRDGVKDQIMPQPWVIRKLGRAEGRK